MARVTRPRKLSLPMQAEMSNMLLPDRAFAVPRQPRLGRAVVENGAFAVQQDDAEGKLVNFVLIECLDTRRQGLAR